MSGPAYWAEVVVTATGDDQEIAGAALLEQAGCHGYDVRDKEVVGYLPIDDRLEESLGRLKMAVDFPITLRRKLAEEDWAHAWKQYFKPQLIGRRFVVKPSWEDFQPEPDQLVIELDPGMAFGTGLHATTRVCLKALEDLPVRGSRVADVGTGSGILALGAYLLGAISVIATDNDPVAVKVSLDNLIRNHVGKGISVQLSESPPSGPFDIVVANILPDVIIGMAHGLIASVVPGGTLVTSGIIHERRQDVINALTAGGTELLSSPDEGEWCAVIVRKLG